MTSVFVVALDLNHADAVCELVAGAQQVLVRRGVVLDVIEHAFTLMVAPIRIREATLIHGFP